MISSKQRPIDTTQTILSSVSYLRIWLLSHDYIDCNLGRSISCEIVFTVNLWVCGVLIIVKLLCLHSILSWIWYWSSVIQKCTYYVLIIIFKYGQFRFFNRILTTKGRLWVIINKFDNLNLKSFDKINRWILILKTDFYSSVYTVF